MASKTTSVFLLLDHIMTFDTTISVYSKPNWKMNLLSLALLLCG